MPHTEIQTRRREQILAAAEHLLTDRGWDALTFAAICQGAQISNGVLTYHFRDKNQLLFALYERITRRIRDQLFQPFICGNGPLRGRLASLFAGLPDETATLHHYRLLTLYFLTIAHEQPPMVERLRALHGESIDLLAERLGRDRIAGEIARDPRQAAGMIVAVLTGFGMMHRDIGLGGTTADAIDLLVAYLTGPPSATTRP
ncbi:MAG: TetR/AcrR family transcriptional regulator [Thermomicrobiales bacterium]